MVPIRKALHVIRSYLILRPVPNLLEALIDYYRQHGVIEAAKPYGLLLGELAHPNGSTATVAVSCLWTTKGAYDSWLAAPERKALIEGMSSLLDPLEPPVGWTEEKPGCTEIDFTAVYGQQEMKVRLTAR